MLASLGVSGIVLLGLVTLCVVVGVLLTLRYRILRAPEHLDLSLKHVVITGGSSGIGKAVAQLCLQRGASVTIIARTVSRLDAAKEELQASLPSDSGVTVVAKAADVTDEASMARVVAEAETEVGRPVDVLVCSAGATNPLAFDVLSTSDFDYVMRVNFLGIINCVKAVLPGMKERRRGRLLFISSQVGQVGMFGYTAYAASKFAVRGFAESLYPEVRPFGIHVSVSYPPDTDTPMYEEEMKAKPVETRLMSESGSVFSAQEIAADIVSGLEDWRFAVSHGFDGKVLALLSGALAPPASLLQVAVEAVTLPILRLVWVFMVLCGWYGIAHEQHALKQKASR